MRRAKLLLAVFLMVFVSCNVLKKNENLDNSHEGMVAFFEFYKTQEGIAIQGNVPMGRRIDAPSYSYDENTGKIEMYRYPSNFSIDTAKVVVGFGKILKGVAGQGVSSYLICSDKIPYSNNGFEIVSVNNDYANVSVNGEKIRLGVGKEWTKLEEKTDTLNRQNMAVVKYKTTYSVKFHGFLPSKEFANK
ncbi:MAG TPA: hypothetical protein PLA24_06465 [Tenuifilaceae bacterium]|nr:hypothetical protein [Tenuifilaceae bacterium]